VFEEEESKEGIEGADAEIEREEKDEIELLRERDRACEFLEKLWRLGRGAPPPILNDSN
jgi:hypothetical protein